MGGSAASGPRGHASVTPVSADSPTVSLEVPSEVTVGAPIPITLRVTNSTNRPLALYLRGRPAAFDLVVAKTDGTIVWRRLAGAVITMVLQVRTLAPGETLEFRDTWKQTTKAGVPVRPGDYVVTGELPTDGPRPLVTPSAPLRILTRERR
jgi:intracellular proteinase inhibitor BsuPI